jgi:(E)-4-hydroxy-3-methylbut-2-enyl-diphosphate synthase
MGVGSTIRISISGSPINEPIIAKKIMSLANLYHKHVNLIVCPTCGRLQ